jgi:hypothetical protein
MIILYKTIRKIFLVVGLLGVSYASFAQDADGDGVNDANDLCPTVAGTNGYGCPITVSGCSFTNTYSVATTTALPTTGTTQYLLVDAATGIVAQVSNTTPTTFTNIPSTPKTYMVVAYSYVAPLTGYTVVSLIAPVAPVCSDYSNALMISNTACVAVPNISINSVIVNEGTAAVLTVSLSGVTTVPVTVSYTTVSGTAGTADYTTTTGTITIPAGQSSATITVPTLTDAVTEGTETLTVVLSNPIGGVIANGTGTVSILDIPPASVCDYTGTSFTVKTVTTPNSAATTQYILADASGKILQINNTPTFSGLTGTAGTVTSFSVYAISYTAAVNNLLVGSNVNQLTGSCFGLSKPLNVGVCVCTPICLPVTVTVVK